MEIFEVGGAVRDELLGRPVKDRDYVVVGSTPEEMSRLGFKPVGKDFPVFLHPDTHAEYALARTERKTALGYHGFQVYAAPDVTLEQDLMRRDLTINAIAKNSRGEIVDPCNGRADIRNKILRHVSAAFSEDPVRVLRLSRFAARYADFSVAPETTALMCAMAASGELDSLVAERVWQELSKGLMEEKPSRMFDVLIEANAMENILPELSALWLNDPIGKRLDRAASKNLGLAARFALLIASIDARNAASDGHIQGNGLEHSALSISQRLHVPRECNDLAGLAIRHSKIISRSRKLNAEGLLNLLLVSDALRRPARFNELLLVCDCLFDDANAAETRFLRDAKTSLADLEPKMVLATKPATADIPGLIRDAQVRKMSEFINFHLSRG
jgi:tRNA nucleotidyltransferase (CCA-adding enzyme)